MSESANSPRFKPLDIEDMTAEQRAVAERMLGGPRKSMRGPFNAMLRSPELTDRVQAVGEYIRFRNVIPGPLREMAIIMAGRHWTAQYEFYAHRKLALQEGLDPAICDAIAANQRPKKLSDDEATVYDFCSELLASGHVSDAQFERTKSRFGEQGVIDLVGTVGYYTIASLVLNVDRHPLPDDAVPLTPL